MAKLYNIPMYVGKSGFQESIPQLADNAQPTDRIPAVRMENPTQKEGTQTVDKIKKRGSSDEGKV